MDLSTYRPSDKILDQLKQFTFVAVVGPTGAGKTTIVEAAVAHEPRLQAVVGDTSRDPRPGEHEGVEYHFCQYEDMVQRAKNQVYINLAVGLEQDLYALNPLRFSKNAANIMPIWAKDIAYFRGLGFDTMRTIYIVPADYEVWQSRFMNREFSPEMLHRRRTEVRQSLVFGLEDEQLHLVINDTLDMARDDFITLALGKALPPRLQADQSRGRELLAHFLERLDTTL